MAERLRHSARRVPPSAASERASHARCRPLSADCGLQAASCCAQCPRWHSLEARAVRNAPASITRFLLAQVPVAHPIMSRASPPGEQSQHPLLRQAIRTTGSSICCLDNSATLEQNEGNVCILFERQSAAGRCLRRYLRRSHRLRR